VENLISPDVVRRLLWDPPGPAAGTSLAEALHEALVGYRVRSWQINLTRPALVEAIEATS
jgi:ribonuclease D